MPPWPISSPRAYRQVAPGWHGSAVRAESPPVVTAGSGVTSAAVQFRSVPGAMRPWSGADIMRLQRAWVPRALVIVTTAPGPRLLFRANSRSARRPRRRGDMVLSLSRHRQTGADDRGFVQTKEHA